MYTASDINYVRLIVGDGYQAAIADVLEPAPDGTNTVFRFSHYPVCSASSPNIYQVVLQNDSNYLIPSASWSFLDAENGVIKVTYAPPASCNYLLADYYNWSFLSDSYITQALTNRAGNWRRAAIDMLMYILADPQGIFFKTYQTGDDNIDDGKYNIPRVQATVQELWRQEGLAEFAGSLSQNIYAGGLSSNFLDELERQRLEELGRDWLVASVDPEL